LLWKYSRLTITSVKEKVVMIGARQFAGAAPPHMSAVAA
jgi:hypothetical protein